MFPFDPTAVSVQPAETLKAPEEITTKKPPVENEDSSCFLHEVTSTDTLAGLALKYKTSKATLKRINHMYNDLVYQRDTIWIPKAAGGPTGPIPSSPDDRKISVVAAFAAQASCTTEEARFYLDMANGVASTAMEHLLSDKAWSTANPTPQ